MAHLRDVDAKELPRDETGEEGEGDDSEADEDGHRPLQTCTLRRLSTHSSCSNICSMQDLLQTSRATDHSVPRSGRTRKDAY